MEKQTGDRIRLTGQPAFASDITIIEQKKTTREVLDNLANTYGWVWWRNPENGDYELMDREAFEETVLLRTTLNR